MLDDHGDAGRWGLSVVALVAATLVLYFFWRTPRTDDRIIGALALLLAGIVGNLPDRMRLGFVVDFIDVQFGAWHYPTFNVADAAICIGAGLLIIDVFLTKKNAVESAGDPETRDPKSGIERCILNYFASAISRSPPTAFFWRWGCCLRCLWRHGSRLVTVCRANVFTILACGHWLADWSGSKLLMFFVEDNVNVFSLDFLRSGGVFYGGLTRWIFCRCRSGSALQTAVLEGCRRLCTRPRSRAGVWTPGLFFRGLLLGQTNDSAVGSPLYRGRPRVHRRSDLRARR